MFSQEEFRGRKACVIGLGKSGLAAVKLLLQNGFPVFATDSRSLQEIKSTLEKLPQEIEWESDGPSQRISLCGFAVKSPGLPQSSDIIKQIRKWNIPIFSEIEVALAFSKTREIAAITGTNGKTTTSALTGEIFRRALPRGQNVFVCGNIGMPAAQCAPQAKSTDALVMETSSYQLEDSSFFHPRTAAILNLKPNHLDHHGNFENYAQAKAKIFRDQNEKDYCIFNAEDPEVLKLARHCPSQKLFFGGSPKTSHAWIEGGRICARLEAATIPTVFSPPELPGRHNLENAMAGILIALSFGLPASAIQEGLSHFKGIEHRLEEVGVVSGMRCVNDSKSTTVDSTLAALEAFSQFKGKIILVLGGLDKGSSYAPLKPLIAQIAKSVITIGSAAKKIEEELDGICLVSHCETLGKAIQTAFEMRGNGDILLFSPACASFDQFENFEDRGEQFKKILQHYT
jgi:UDP-N-acetylmuramoylalanine--D-glutamate ligase